MLLAAFAHPVAAQQADVIRGRVTGPDNKPIENVTVTVTSFSGNVNRVAKTDKNGRFTVTFGGDEGDYFVAFAAFGYAAKRFEVKRTADQDILVADTKLQPVATKLDAVKVVGTREKPNRNDVRPDISGTERGINNAAVSADQLGDIAAMAASLPGVQLIPSADGTNGFSVLGLAPDQNNVTLNGMNFGAANLPRDAAVSSSLVTSPYDVSRGGFSGAQFSFRSRPGSNFIMRTMSINVDQPQMQWTDRAANSLGQRYSNLSLGGMLAGPIKYDKAFYNVAYQFGRRSNDLQSLLNTSPLGLQTSGIAPDSVTRLLGLLAAAQVPTMVGGIPNSRVTDQGSLFGSFDFNPPFSNSGQTFNVTMNGSWNRQTPASALTTEVPAHSGDRTSWNGGLQGRHTNYFGFGILSETSVAFSQSNSYATPYLEMPSGSVRVSSTFADGTSGVKTVSFGGSPSMNTSVRSNTVGGSNQLSWFSENNKHRLKLATELRRDGYEQDQTTNLLGSFYYNSLTDFQANTPAAFTRQLSARQRSGSQIVGAVSLGDSYRRNDDLQVQYGLRLDGNRFLSDPALNPDVANTFGIRNDNVPNKLYVSPRVGFSYTYGTAPQISMFEGAIRGPRAVVRGGIGVFQNTPGTTLIGSAVDNTGLPTAVQQLMCVGAATPVPDWAAYATDPSQVPTRCADGSTGTVFSNTAPNVTLFDPAYAASRSVRSNLQWNGMVLDNRFFTSVEGTFSRNLNQPSFVDLNFNPTVQFTLGDEGYRPVYVQPSSIVATTGTVAPSGARVSPLFSQVRELKSDLQSESRQIRVSVNPFNFNSTWSWNLSYVYSNVREQVRGFSSTARNPLDVEWARATYDSRHQITYGLSYNAFDFVRMSWYGSFRSGTPFTPLIANDVNGDGYANDRAFVFKPSTAADSAVAAGMQSLLTNGSGIARDCLQKQLGHLAERNSCQSPWTSSANLTFSFNPVKVRMPQRATLSFQLANPLAAADMLLHGENRQHGWGQMPIPDQSLLFVRGFDAQRQRYIYEVNQRFGATNPAFSAIRAPVTLTAMVRVDVGPTRERQMLTSMLNRGRRSQGQKMPEAMLKAMYGTGGVFNPMAQILRQADTLQLTSNQADSVATLNRWYTIRLDSIWSPIAKYLAALPDKYNEDEAYDKYRVAREESVDLLIKLAPSVKGLLTADQQRKLPSFVMSFLDQRYLASIRSGTAGFGMGMMSVPAGAQMMMGGGGERQIIITR